MLQRLPCEYQGPILRCIEELPLHRLEIAHNLGCFEEISDYCLKRGVVGDWISILRDQVHMR